VRPWDTAAKHYTINDNGLQQPWAGRVWLNHICSCGVDPVAISSLNENQTMPKMQQGIAGNGEAFCTKGGKTSSVADGLVPKLPTGARKRKTGAQEIRPERESPVAGGKATICTQSKGHTPKTPAISNGQSPSQTTAPISAMEMDAERLAAMQGNLGQPMRILRCDRGDDARPLYSACRSELSRNDSVEHGSSLFEVQHKQATETPDGLVQGQVSRCPNCGKTGLSIVKKYRVFLNPPYGLEAVKWLQRMAQHGNGVALTFARTETAMFFPWIWEYGAAFLFLKGRLFFHFVDGSRAKANSGAPSILVAYGESNAICLEKCGLPGKFLRNPAALFP